MIDKKTMKRRLQRDAERLVRDILIRFGQKPNTKLVRVAARNIVSAAHALNKQVKAR